MMITQLSMFCGNYCLHNAVFLCVTVCRCNYGGTCVDDATSSLGFKCLCKPGFSGTYCQISKSLNNYHIVSFKATGSNCIYK